jgi:hypothetical protein
MNDAERVSSKLPLADRFELAANPRRVCLIPLAAEEADDRLIVVIVAVHTVSPETIVVGNGHDDTYCTTYTRSTGRALDNGRLGEKLRVPRSELDRVEDFEIQGAYGSEASL